MTSTQHNAATDRHSELAPESQKSCATNIITDNLDLWTSSIKAKSASGRGNSKKRELYGIKKLRELILELAVRGKLVPQDPNDEPASELLKRIEAEKAQLVKDNKIKKEKTLPDVTIDEAPFAIPDGWALARIGNLVSKLGSGSTPRGGKAAYVEQGIPFLRSQNVWNHGLVLNDIAYIKDETHEKMSNTKVFPGDVLLNITGASLGRSIIFPKKLVEANVSQHVTIIRLVQTQMSRFVHLGILSPMIQRLVWGRQVGMAIEGLSKKVLEMFEFPIPPLEEQHRIVAKVDELLALCDQLEQQTEHSITAHETLVETLLGTLTNAKDAEELSQHWLRISEHFDTLFTTEHSIEQLKQTILQLAVMGKLVPQDPNDEPAAVLLDKIAAEKAQLIKDKKIKKQKQLPPISDDEKLFELPPSWEWCNLQDLFALITDGDHQAPPKSDSGIPFLVIGNLNKKFVDTRNCKYVPNEYYAKLDWGRRPKPRDVLYTVTGSYGIPIRVDTDEEFCVQRHVAIFKSADSTPEKYLERFLGSKIAFEYSTRVATGIAQKTVPLTGLRKMPVAVSPQNEQHRIVAKVNKLMALCDQLKAKLQHAQQTQLHLANAVVEQGVS